MNRSGHKFDGDKYSAWEYTDEQAYQKLKACVANQLLSAGWSLVSKFDMAYTPAVATKKYMTAVGEKEAIVYLNPSSKDVMSQLVGQYESEGCNILSTCTFTIEYEMSNNELQCGIETFIQNVEERVSDSYAVRLFKH